MLGGSATRKQCDAVKLISPRISFSSSMVDFRLGADTHPIGTFESKPPFCAMNFCEIAMPTEAIFQTACSRHTVFDQKAHGKRGRIYVAAPVLGRAVDMAAEGKLFVIAGGAAEGLSRCAPLFAAIGQRTFEFGPDPVTAVAAKLAINFLVVSAIEAMSEAFALTAKYGVRASDFYEFITNTLFGTPDIQSLRQAHRAELLYACKLRGPPWAKGCQTGDRRGRAGKLSNATREHRARSLGAGACARISRPRLVRY